MCSSWFVQSLHPGNFQYKYSLLENWEHLWTDKSFKVSAILCDHEWFPWNLEVFFSWTEGHFENALLKVQKTGRKIERHLSCGLLSIVNNNWVNQQTHVISNSLRRLKIELTTRRILLEFDAHYLDHQSSVVKYVWQWLFHLNFIFPMFKLKNDVTICIESFIISMFWS